MYYYLKLVTRRQCTTVSKTWFYVIENIEGYIENDFSTLTSTFVVFVEVVNISEIV